MIEFANPYAFLLLPLPFIIRYIFPSFKQYTEDALKVPFINDIIKIQEQSKTIKFATFGMKAHKIMQIILLWLIWVCAVVALCRPQWVGEPIKVRHEGRDIMLVVDISNSMRENDFKWKNYYYDRLTAVKAVVSEFVDNRVDDRIGLVLFGTRAYQQVPLTFDRNSLKEVLNSVQAGMAGTSTAIGDALGLALKNLAKENKDVENQLIILLTDGENNDGKMSVPEAIKLAEQEKVKVYTIGAGSDSEPMWNGLFGMYSAGSGIDETSLQQLAKATKGRYFRATDVSSLLQIYEEINRLEKQEKEGRFVQERKDLFYYPATIVLSLFIVLFEILRRKS